VIERAEQSARDVQDDIAQGDRGAGTSSERRRCGVWGRDSSSCTTAARRI